MEEEGAGVMASTPCWWTEPPSTLGSGSLWGIKKTYLPNESSIGFISLQLATLKLILTKGLMVKAIGRHSFWEISMEKYRCFFFAKEVIM